MQPAARARDVLYVYGLQRILLLVADHTQVYVLA